MPRTMPPVECEPLIGAVDRDAERRLGRKLDRHLGVLVLVFLFCHIDRNSYATARLGGLERE